MEKLQISAYAKINISIDIKGVREDGYHEVEMIMQTIPLCDIITIAALPKMGNNGISVTCTNPRLPVNQNNLVYKAARMLFDLNGMEENISIHIEKHIPVGGGLGGGSADCAAVLKAINMMYRLNHTTEELMEIGAKLGADVPFLVKGGCMLAKGTGTALTPVPSIKKGWLLLVNPGIFMSTERVYKKYDTLDIPKDKHPDIPNLIKALSSGNLNGITRFSGNVLEVPAFAIRPELRDIKAQIRSKGAFLSMMSGSGATLFGIFHNADRAWNAMKEYRKKRMFAVVMKL